MWDSGDAITRVDSYDNPYPTWSDHLWESHLTTHTGELLEQQWIVFLNLAQRPIQHSQYHKHTCMRLTQDLSKQYNMLEIASVKFFYLFKGHQIHLS